MAPGLPHPRVRSGQRDHLDPQLLQQPIQAVAQDRVCEAVHDHAHLQQGAGRDPEGRRRSQRLLDRGRSGFSRVKLREREWYLNLYQPMTLEAVVSVTASQARARLFPLIQSVNDDQAAIEIVSRNGTAFLVSAEEYLALKETVYLLSSPANAARLRDSIAAHRDGRAEERGLLDAGDDEG